MAIFGIKLFFGLMGLRTNGPSDNKADPNIDIQMDGIRSRREMAARECLASQGRRREPGRQPPGVLHIARDH